MPKDHLSTSSRPGRAAQAWAVHGWPVLAGVLVAVGFIGLHLAYNLIALVLVPVGVWCLSAVMLYGLLTDCGVALRNVLRTATVATAVVMSLLGLLLIHPIWGWVAAAVGGVSSPAFTDRAARILRRIRGKHGVGRTTPQLAGARLDHEQVDRRFARLVKDLEDDPGSPPLDIS